MTSLKETLQAKNEIERHASGAGVSIKPYHADNSRFIDTAWTDDLKIKNQVITLCRVNTHHKKRKLVANSVKRYLKSIMLKV
jgi:hypothetical protein